MKKTTRIITILALILLIVLPISAHPVKEEAQAAEAAPAVVEAAPAIERITYATVDDADLISKFNYSYGYELAYALLVQDVSIDGKYYARGILDGYDAYYLEPLISAENMDAAVSTYIATFYSMGLSQGAGEILPLEELFALETPEGVVEAFSYAYGFMYAYQLYYQNGLPIDPMVFMQGAVDAIYEFEPVYDGATRDAIIEEYSNVLQAEYEEYMGSRAENNLLDAEEFLALYKDSDQVVNLNDKVLLQVMYEDETLGATPKETDSVVVDYALYLLDGSVIDQGTDVTFNLQQLIPGFTLACTNMKVGQAAYAYIHPDYGYGESGAGSSIEPNCLLIFEIYLKGIVE